MKKILFLAILNLIALTTSAQNYKKFKVRNKAREIEIHYGVKGGLNYTSLGGDSQGGSYKIGFNAGVFGLFKLSDNFGVMPEIVYSVQGTQITQPTSVKIDYNYINVPLLLNIYASQILFFQTGPQLGWLTSASISGASTGLNLYDTRTQLDLSFAFGAGMDFEKLLINARYNAGLSSTSSAGTGSYPNSVFQISVNVPIK